MKIKFIKGNLFFVQDYNLIHKQTNKQTEPQRVVSEKVHRKVHPGRLGDQFWDRSGQSTDLDSEDAGEDAVAASDKGGRARLETYKLRCCVEVAPVRDF